MLPISSNRTVGCVISMASIPSPKNPAAKHPHSEEDPWLLAMVSKIFSQFLMILIASSVGRVSQNDKLKPKHTSKIKFKINI